MAEAKAWVIIPKLDSDKTGCVLQVFPLVQCKDCKHFERVPRESVYDCHEYYCHNLMDYVTSSEWFCADGEEISDVQKSD